jgi:apolipoprotein D and lipocalin family protein
MDSSRLIPAILVAAIAGCGGGTVKGSTLKTVESADLDSYLGTWYEIARYPNRFQKGCHGSTATYSLRDDGRIAVVNTCRKGGADGKLDKATGKAWVVDTKTNAKLKVSFFWPFAGDYWIIDLDEGYEYAVVGHPERTYLWILSRSPKMDRATYEAICGRLVGQGYDPEKLVVEDGAIVG